MEIKDAYYCKFIGEWAMGVYACFNSNVKAENHIKTNYKKCIEIYDNKRCEFCEVDTHHGSI